MHLPDSLFQRGDHETFEWFGRSNHGLDVQREN